jgi:hypothetical protein
MVASITDFSLREKIIAEFVPKPNCPFLLVVLLAFRRGVNRYRASALFWCGVTYYQGTSFSPPTTHSRNPAWGLH